MARRSGRSQPRQPYSPDLSSDRLDQRQSLGKASCRRPRRSSVSTLQHHFPVPVISAHPLRHTAATLLLNERGANLRDMQALLGHKHRNNSTLYARRFRAAPHGRGKSSTTLVALSFPLSQGSQKAERVGRSQPTGLRPSCPSRTILSLSGRPSEMASLGKKPTLQHSLLPGILRRSVQGYAARSLAKP